MGSMFVKIWIAVGLMTALNVAMAQVRASNAVPEKKSEGPSEYCRSMAALDYQDEDKTIRFLRGLFQASQFRQLDQALSCLMDNPKRFLSGKTGSSVVYWTFRLEIPAPGVRPEQLVAVQQWRKENPGSLFAEFADLRAQYSSAWNARGTAYAKDVPNAGLQAFEAGLTSVEKSALAASPKLRNTAIWHNLMLAVILDMPQSVTNPQQIFGDGVWKWPEYYDFQELVISRMVPRWGGTWEMVEKFIDEQSRSRKRQEGDSLYARLYASLNKVNENVPAMRIDWPRMKRSLDDLILRYPVPAHKNLAASYACVFKDTAYFNVSMKRIGAEEYVQSSWINGTNPQICKL